MGSAFAKAKNFFGSEPDSEASTRANTKTNAKSIPVSPQPLRRTQSIDSPRAARSLSESNASSTSPKKQKKIQRQVRASFKAQRSAPSVLLSL